jgi:hypothetical protein
VWELCLSVVYRVISQAFTLTWSGMDGFVYDGFEHYTTPQHFVTFDYETGYSHATQDCQMQVENITMVVLLLVSLLATMLALVVGPCVRRPHPRTASRFD